METSSSVATAYHIHVGPGDTGLLKCEQTEETASTASELLQKDLEQHHVFFNDRHYHNHIAHHILSLYGTGAPPPSLHLAFTRNASYQRPALPARTEDLHHSNSAATVTPIVQALEENYPLSSPRYLGHDKYYPDFLLFFQRALQTKGIPGVLLERVFAATPDADDLLARLFAGLLHPLIQLMFGLEFAQPAVVAQGLAQAAVHDGTAVGRFLLQAEERARRLGGDGGGDCGENGGEVKRLPSLIELYEAVAANPKLRQVLPRAAAAREDGDEEELMGMEAVLRDGLEELIEVAARVRVDLGEVEERTAEMFDAAMFVAASAALEHRGSKYPKFDFFLIHDCNASPIFPTLNQQPWLPVEAKARILKWKVRMDLLQYAALACPPLSIEAIEAYEPHDKKGAGTTVEAKEIISRLHDFDDDGHAIKLGRAAAICYKLSKQYEERPWMKIRGDEMWSKVANLIVDSVQAPGAHWVRMTGLEEAWKDIPNTPEVKL